MYVGNLTIIGSDNGLSHGRRQVIIITNAGILSIGPLWTNFNEILIGIQTFSFKKMHFKMSAKWRPFCLGLIVLIRSYYLAYYPGQDDMEATLDGILKSELLFPGNIDNIRKKIVIYFQTGTSNHLLIWIQFRYWHTIACKQIQSLFFAFRFVITHKCNQRHSVLVVKSYLVMHVVRSNTLIIYDYRKVRCHPCFRKKRYYFQNEYLEIHHTNKVPFINTD